jgi:hypothetical protein
VTDRQTYRRTGRKTDFAIQYLPVPYCSAAFQAGMQSDRKSGRMAGLSGRQAGSRGRAERMGGRYEGMQEGRRAGMQADRNSGRQTNVQKDRCANIYTDIQK